MRVSKVPWKFHIPTIYNFAAIYPWNLLFSWKVAYFLTISIVFSVHKQNFTAQKLAEMRKFQCLLSVLKQSYICYYVFCMTVPLKSKSPFFPLNKNIQTLINAIPNRKWKFAHMFLERQTLCFSSFKNCQLKVKLWWDGACEIKKGAFFVTFISSKGIFLTVVFYLNV